MTFRVFVAGIISSVLLMSIEFFQLVSYTERVTIEKIIVWQGVLVATLFFYWLTRLTNERIFQGWTSLLFSKLLRLRINLINGIIKSSSSIWRYPRAKMGSMYHWYHYQNRLDSTVIFFSYHHDCCISASGLALGIVFSAVLFKRKFLS